jgi:transcriptional regulator with XRE-family HTH domain
MDSPTVRERRLARELRVLREAAQLHGNQAAAALGWSPSKVSRIETGRTGVTDTDLERLLALYDVQDEHAARVRSIAPSVRPRGWWDAYADTLSAGYAGLIRMEAGSRSLRTYCAVVPHALLQTPDLAREVIRTTWRRPPAQEVERRVQICRRRQDVLERAEPLRLHAVLDEAVLRRRTGDALRGQVAHLLEVSAHPHVVLQVLPFAAGLPPVTAGSFSVLEPLSGAGPDVVYLENKTRIFFLEAEEEVHGYAREMDLLCSLALSPEDTADWLRDLGDRL